MLESPYTIYKNIMTLQSNISIAQLLLGIVGTLVTVATIVFSSYLSLKVENGVLNERVATLEKKVEKTDEKFDKIMDKLSALEVKIGKVEK